jgi:V/A-type H+-transporting ATPase subunit D
MARFDLPATKANLLRLKDDLALAREGRQLLDEKREILLRELFRHLADLKRCRKEADLALADAYAALREACLALGRDAAARAALAQREPPEVSAQERSILGVVVPILRCEALRAAPSWGLLGTSIELDVARERFRSAMSRLVALAEVETAFRSLAAELRRTQKRINALQNLLIPQYQETVGYIEGSLEEREREALFQMKRVKARGESQ